MILRAVLVLALLFAATPLAAQTPVSVGDTFTVTSPVMGKDRELNVLLPEGYEAEETRYPIIYVLDGGQAQDFPAYATMIRQAIMDGQMQPVIVVGIASEDRQNELTERASDRQILSRWPNHGQSDRFRRFLADEVKPWVESRYRTNGEDAVLGESAAALFIVEAYLRQPALFDRYLAISPSLWWDDEALSKNAATLLSTHPVGDRLLLLSIADEGGPMQAGLDRVMTALNQTQPRGLTWRYEPRHDLTHSTIYQAVAPVFVREAFPVSENPAR